MEKPLVSVVMPSYNHAEYVGRAIESVLNQTYSNFEFIIVDDASSDNSAEVIRQYKDERIMFTQLVENIGFGAGEYAYKKANGKYIATIGSDDMWKPDLLEKYVSFLEENEEYVCCFSRPEIINECDVVIHDEEKERVFAVENRTKEEWFKLLYMQGNRICGPSMCLRRSTFEILGIMRFQYRQLQDYEYWMRLVQIGNIYIYPEKLMMYRVHQNGSNRNISEATEEVNIRDVMERKFIMYDIMESVEESYFIKAFEDKLLLRPEAEGFCIECEKFGIMLNSIAVPVHAAIFYYFKHYNNERFRYCLENFYHVKRKDFWGITGKEHDRVANLDSDKVKIEELIKMVYSLKQEVELRDKKIEELLKNKRI